MGAVKQSMLGEPDDEEDDTIDWEDPDRTPTEPLTLKYLPAGDPSASETDAWEPSSNHEGESQC